MPEKFTFLIFEEDGIEAGIITVYLGKRRRSGVDILFLSFGNKLMR